jgi:hypothetical protein
MRYTIFWVASGMPWPLVRTRVLMMSTTSVESLKYLGLADSGYVIACRYI